MSDTLTNTLICRRGPTQDGSGACTGTSQQIFPTNENRRYLLVQNVSDVSIYVNLGGPATIDQNSIKLLPNDSVVFEDGFIPTDEVTALGTSGKKFVAKQG